MRLRLACIAGLLALGLTVFGDQSVRMNNVVGVHIPEGVGDAAVRGAMLNDYGIEIGTSFGQLHGKIWRIGAMGYNARKDCVLLTLAALETVLAAEGHKFTRGAGIDAAYGAYEG